MAQSFVLIVQQPLDFKGRHYEPGDRLIADPFESGTLQRKKLTIEAPREEQIANGRLPQFLDAMDEAQLRRFQGILTSPEAQPAVAELAAASDMTEALGVALAETLAGAETVIPEHRRRGRPRKAVTIPEAE